MLIGRRRNPFTNEDDQHLVEYLATYSPGIAGRCGNNLYKNLVENVDEKWSWNEQHTWQSWRERYKKSQDWFNRRIRLYQKKNLPREHHTAMCSSKPKQGRTTMLTGRRRVEAQQLLTKRTPFTDEDDQHLVKYLAIYSPGIAGRCGNNLYKDLVENVDGKWPWSKEHPWQSWRERHRKNQDWFNHHVRLYQKEKNLPQEHHKVPRSSKPKKGPTTAAEDETDDNEEVRQRKRKRVSETGNGSNKRREHDQGSGQARAVAGPSKHRPSALSSENTNTEEEDEAGPVHPDDYGGEIFADREPDDDEYEANAMLTDGVDEEIHDLPELPNSPHEDHGPVYRELHLPGRYDSVHSRPVSPAEFPIRNKRRPFLIDPSQEPTPPVSGADDSTLTIDAYVSVKKPAVRPLLLKDPLITNPTNKNQSKSSEPRRQNIDDGPFETPPPTPVCSQPAAKPKLSPILAQGGFRTDFNSRSTGAGSDSDSAVEIVDTKKAWRPQRNKGIATLSKTLVKPKNDTGSVQKVDKGKDKDQNIEAAPSTNRLKGTEMAVDRLAKGRPSLVHRPRRNSPENRSRMDLHEVALRCRTTLFQSTSTHPSSRSFTPLNMPRPASIVGSLPPEELEVVFEFGVRGALEKMAADLGFAYKPVQLIFEQTKSFSKTLVVLRRIMEAGNKVGNEALAELTLEDDKEEEEEDDDEANQSHILDGLFFDTRHKPEAKRSSLNVKPFLDDDQISEYSPSTKYRAGQCSRLVKQGREEEALSRERQCNEPLPRNSSPPMQHLTQSPPPTLHPKAEPSDLTSDTGKLSEEEMYELFGGPLSQSTAEDSESQIQPKPNIQELKAEFIRLVTVTAHHTTALEEFEKKLDPDVVRAWTMEMILERTAPPLKSSP